MPVLIVLLVLLILGELFTLLLQCRRGHSAWGLLRLFRYAHRGYHDKPRIPENSMAAFRRAIENGYGAELDVHLMKDGRLAVIHDASLRHRRRRRAGGGPDGGGAEAVPPGGHR